MRNSSISLAIAVLLAGAVVVAQTHNNMVEKKVSEEIRLSTDLKVGSQVLKAGLYRVACDRETIRFSRIETVPGSIFTTVTKVLEVPCQGKDLGARRERTELSMPVGKDGVPFLEKLYLRGSNIEHVFPN
jgi:hypothetical protein